MNKVKRILQLLLMALLVQLSSLAAAQERVTYIHTDALGSPIAASDEDGNFIWRESYQPYGKRIRLQKGSDRPWYTGKYEEDIGLVYYGKRWYNPEIGRFYSVDPVRFNEANIHSFNRYAYANNNPYRFVDPDGALPLDTIWDAANIVYDIFTGDKEALAADTAALFIPYLPAGATKLTKLGSTAKKAEKASKSVPDITKAYKRPSGATTQAQRQSVQGKPCVDCGAKTSKQFADHKDPLVKEYYRTGTIDKTRMRDVGSVQPQCPTCSSRQGAGLSRFSRQMKKERGLE